MKQAPEITPLETAPLTENHTAEVTVKAASELALRTEVSALYHEQSTRMGARSKFNAEPRQTYNRGLSQYESGINELSSTGESLFKIEDWTGKVMLDIGSGGYDKAGMEARRAGVQVISLNPALRKQESRDMLAEGVHMNNQRAQDTERDIWARQNFIKRFFTRPATAAEMQSDSVAALGQALPLRDGSVDVVVSMYGVPHYLHHHMFGPEASQDTPETRAQDIALITTTFKEIERVLKPGGKAFLKDSYGTPQGPNDVDMSGVPEALAQLEHTQFVIHNAYDAADPNVQNMSGSRIIELTKI